MNERKNTQNGSSPTMNLSDIYFVLFRHKWKILSFWAAGIAAAAGLYFFKPPLYTSAAKLYVRYVVETKPSGTIGGTQIRTPDDRGENIINSEVEILTSIDTAQEVVHSIGAERILAALGGGTNANQAAGFVKKNIAAAPIKHSDVMLLIFQHPDRQMAQPILRAVIAAYLEKHRKIHNDLGGADDVLSRQIAEIRAQVTNTTEALRQARARAGVVDLAEAKRANAARISRLQDDILAAQASLAEHEAALTRLVRTEAPAVKRTNAPVQVPAEKISEYRSACQRLESLREERDVLLSWATTNNLMVLSKQAQIDAVRKSKADLEAAYPQLPRLMVPSASASQQGTGLLLPDPNSEAVLVEGLNAKIKVLTNELAQVKSDQARVEQWETVIEDLQTRKAIEETNYMTFSTSLSQARFNETLQSAKLANIGVAQEPSPPYRDLGQLYKLLAIVVAAGLGAGLGLAFLLELYLDPTLKRPGEIEARLRLPLFISIPDTAGVGNGHGVAGSGRKLLAAPAELAQQMELAANQASPWETDHQLRPFFEALRDRLISHFDLVNLRHSPKIVAVTSCGKGAGVSTIAAGLAATLSGTGEGNVLLVDMNRAKSGAAQSFHRGKPALTVAEALQGEKREEGLVQDHLYVATEGDGGEKGPGILPNRFAYLVPKLRASDYDYIIFDMPPVSQISVTSKLARLMDMNLLVVESEKTGREVARQAGEMLSGTAANVGIVLNKKKTYVPEWLHQEL